MLILSIDTSQICSVALHQDSDELACVQIALAQSASSYLNPMIEYALRFSGVSIHDIDVVAVAKGPGSYTGLRVGASAAKGLCFALGRPLVAIDTLRGMAQQVIGVVDPDAMLCPMLDARRMEVYCALFDGRGNILSPSKPMILSDVSFAEILSEAKVLFFGNGAEKAQGKLRANTNAQFLNRKIVPVASTIGQLAYPKALKGEFEDIARLEPLYLKEYYFGHNSH